MTVVDPVLREAIAAAVQAALAKSEAPTFKPAVVINVDVSGVIAEVQCDGPEEPIFGAQLLNTAVFPGDRVEIMFAPPAGAFVIGRRGGDFDPWHFVGHAGEPSFTTGWRNDSLAEFPGNDDFALVSFRRMGRIVELRGRAERFSGAATNIFSLPPDYRPENDLNFMIIGVNGLLPEPALVTVFRSGLIQNTSHSVLHLDGIMYSTNPAAILEDS
jgi:hypothetical protein